MSCGENCDDVGVAERDAFAADVTGETVVTTAFVCGLLPGCDPLIRKYPETTMIIATIPITIDDIFILINCTLRVQVVLWRLIKEINNKLYPHITRFRTVSHKLRGYFSTNSSLKRNI